MPMDVSYNIYGLISTSALISIHAVIYKTILYNKYSFCMHEVILQG